MPIIPAPTIELTRFDEAPMIDDFFFGMDSLLRLPTPASPATPATSDSSEAKPRLLRMPPLSLVTSIAVGFGD